MFKIWDAIPESINIIITHGPPQGILDIVTHYSQDRTYTNVLEYCGCFSLRKWCEKNQPDLVCFGHIHNNQKNINAGIRTIANSNTIFSNGSCVTDAKFDYGCTSHGNVFEVDENKKITICQ